MSTSDKKLVAIQVIWGAISFIIMSWIFCSLVDHFLLFHTGWFPTFGLIFSTAFAALGLSEIFVDGYVFSMSPGIRPLLLGMFVFLKGWRLLKVEGQRCKEDIVREINKEIRK